MTKPLSSIVLAAIALCFAAQAFAAAGRSVAPVRLAQMSDRLSQDKLGDIEPGTYIAGDAVEFALDRLDDFYLLRIEGSPEIFTLKPDPAAMGGRVLKYDTGETAIRVAGWGGITFYSDARPGGLPVSRTGDSTPPRRGSVSMGEIQKAARDEAAHSNMCAA